MSREVASLAVFYSLLGAYALVTAAAGLTGWISPELSSHAQNILGWAASLSGLGALYFMHRIYRIPARPFWDHWQVLTAFYGNMLALGSLVVGLVYGWMLHSAGNALSELMEHLAWPLVAGLMLEGLGLYFHAGDMQRRGAEGAAALYRQRTGFARTYQARNIGLVLSIIAAASATMTAVQGTPGMIIWTAMALLVTATAVLSRAMFYAVVIPTTMPGGFFWRNEGFQQHAREIGLAQMPQVGVLPKMH